MSVSRLTLALVLAPAISCSGAAAVGAQEPPTLTADGTAAVKPAPADRHSDTSIATAVAAAQHRALPSAVANARAHAAALAAAAGLTLGPLIAISDAPNAASPFFYSPQNGTFGNGHFCGKVRNYKVVRRNGIPRRVALKGTHKVCRVPSTVTASVALTYQVSG